MPRPTSAPCSRTASSCGFAGQRSVPAQSVEFSADGTRFAAVYADRIAIHDGASEAEVLPPPCSLQHRLALQALLRKHSPAAVG